MTDKEKLNLSSPEFNSGELQDINNERQDKLRDALEKNVESKVENGEKAEARARQEALEAAIKTEKSNAEREDKGKNTSPAQKRKGPISKKAKDQAFKKEMTEVQKELTPGSRAFSKVIHNKAIERTSEVVGQTVARPNAILYGALFSFVLVLVVLIIAKYYGYALSGFEMIGTFIIGWILGNLFDYLGAMITGKR